MHWISSDEELALAASVCRPEYHGQHCMTGVSTRKEVFTGVSPVPGARPTQRFLNRKHMRKIELEPWQRTIVLNNPGHFARGLFHSDGYRGINRVRARLADGERWYEYPRYLFTNESKDILRVCGQTLDRLGVA